MYDDARMVYPHDMNHLPDPEQDPQFYDGVSSKRLVAWFIDFVVILALTALVTLIAGILTLGIGFVAAPAIFFAVAFLYRTLTIAARSATWGMQFMGIELRGRTGDRFDLPEAAIHTGIFMILMATMIGWLATVVCILGSRYGQGIPDFILGSTAINRPAD